MNRINYAAEYSATLAQAFPYALHYGALWGAPNNGRYRFSGGKKIELPVITVAPRSSASRDALPELSRSYENRWEEKTLANQRCWSTLIHPEDVDQTAGAASIENVTRVYNDERKFPEMDAYLVSKLFGDFTELGGEVVRAELSSDNVMAVFDGLMAGMTEALVPVGGRVLYVTPAVKNMIKESAGGSRLVSGTGLERDVLSIDGVKVVEVPSLFLKTAYDLSDGVEPAGDAEQIQMFLVHPDSVITPVSYQFACLDEPTAATGGKYVYYEESFEDVFILENRYRGLAFVLPED